MLDEWIKTYGRRLWGLCLKLCGSRSRAEELYQDTWLRVLEKQDRYDPDQPFEPWLTRICVNLYRSRLRRWALQPQAQFATQEDLTAFLEGVPDTPQKSYQDLYDAVNTLPEKLRLTVILYYFKDMDVPATANLLKVPAGTVKSRLGRARKQLREVLGDEADHVF